jgi:hyaluronoglucosaminidase
MFDNDPETYYHSGQGQRTDDFVAADMGIVRTVRELRIIQGRNSVDDVDYFDHVIVEYSADGEEWIALTEPLEGVYDIVWRGEPFEARYVGIRKLESKKRNWLAIRSFDINPVTKEQYGEDCNPFTALRPEGCVHIDLADVSRLVVLMEGIDAGSCLHLFDANGAEVEQRTLSSAYLSLDDVASLNATSATIEGVGQIFEIIRF